MTWSQRKACLPFLSAVGLRSQRDESLKAKSRASSPCSIIDTRVLKEKTVSIHRFVQRAFQEFVDEDGREQAEVASGEWRALVFGISFLIIFFDI